ncbi:RNA recognition motif containing protein [Colletotrichum chrysophilum]|uniref:RNA recognition motif containing protein n=1 Tax=Colletotrichum chrysophilum TaxID=1836956 RepID=A0AAD9A2U9_9PEZI|nr:RNA recognition motif containing protein [Colletotrichum chrysophilum]
MGSREQPAALLEDRRIYLGNLLYVVRPVEIEDTLKDNDFGNFEKIVISVDPVNGRNPGYCFVDFVERADAERALSSLCVDIRGRPVKVGPCEPKKQRQRVWGREEEPNDKRLGNWTGQQEPGAEGTGDSPYEAMGHFDKVVGTDGDGRRLYIGGLTRMIDQQQAQEEMRDILAGFNPKEIGKRVTPHIETRSKPGNHHYCFVDFETVEEAAAVIKALNGKEYAGGALQVSVAQRIPVRIREPSRLQKEDSSWRGRPPPQSDRPRDEQSGTGWTRNPAPRESKDDWPTMSAQSSTNSSQPSWPVSRTERRSEPDRSSWKKMGSGTPNSSSSKTDQPLRSLASSNWRQKS